jgi:hypothetical protein
MIQPRFVKALTSGLSVWLRASLSLAELPRQKMSRITGGRYGRVASRRLRLNSW